MRGLSGNLTVSIIKLINNSNSSLNAGDNKH